MPLATYTVKVLCHNTNYVWEGVIGNTSSSFVGEGVWRSGTNQIESLAIDGTNAYVGMGHNEGQPQVKKFVTTSPQSTTAVKQFTLQGDFKYVATDGTRVYCANSGTSVWNPGNYSFVTAYNVSDNQQYQFSSSTSTVVLDTGWSTDPETTFTKCIDVSSQTGGSYDQAFVNTNGATGIAVMKTGSVLAVAHGPLNVVRLFNKTTGAPLTSINVANPKGLAFTMNGNLLVISGTTIKKYSGVGTTNTLAATISAFASPVSIAANPANENQIVIGDSSTQQFKVYDTSTNSVVRTLGVAGGYSAVSGPNVTNDKFVVGAPIGFQSDGSTWVYDKACERLMHFSSTGAYIEQIMYRRNYLSTIDTNSPKRVFHGFLEYEIDFNKPLLPGDATNVAKGGNESWKLIKNWAAGLTANIGDANPQFRGFERVVGFGGRTYAVTTDTSTSDPISGGPLKAILELPASGPARDTGVRFNPTWSLQFDLSLSYGIVTNDKTPSGNQIFYDKPYTGADANGNPTWGAPVALASTSAKANEPSAARSSWPSAFPVTNSGVLVCLSNADVGGKALGGVAVNGSGWLWKASPCILDNVPLDGLGSYEIGDNGNTLFNASNNVLFSGRNIFYGFHGEFWNQSQANQFMHFYDNGLFIGQFGTSGDIVGTSGSVLPGQGGNSFSPQVGVNQLGAYLYHTDESFHGGVQRWRIDGMYTSFEITGSKTIVSGSNTLTMVAPTTYPFPYGLKFYSGSGAVRLQWLACAGASTYKILRRDTAGNEAIVATGITALTFDSTGLTNGIPYYFRVIGIDSGGGEIERSEEVMCMPFDKTQRVANVGQAAFQTRVANYNLDVNSANLTKGGYPLTFHSMFSSLGVSANLRPYQLSVGSEGYRAPLKTLGLAFFRRALF